MIVATSFRTGLIKASEVEKTCTYVCRGCTSPVALIQSPRGNFPLFYHISEKCGEWYRDRPSSLWKLEFQNAFPKEAIDKVIHVQQEQDVDPPWLKVDLITTTGYHIEFIDTNHFPTHEFIQAREREFKRMVWIVKGRDDNRSKPVFGPTFVMSRNHAFPQLSEWCTPVFLHFPSGFYRVDTIGKRATTLAQRISNDILSESVFGKRLDDQNFKDIVCPQEHKVNTDLRFKYGKTESVQTIVGKATPNEETMLHDLGFTWEKETQCWIR